MDFYLATADERKELNEKMEIETGIREKRNRRRNERKAGEESRGATGVFVKCLPPCITSLRCFGTDDIVWLGGGWPWG